MYIYTKKAISDWGADIMDAAVTCILELSKALNTKVYLVGGSIRDLLLNREIKDLDFVVFGDVKNFAGQVADRLKGSFIELDTDMGTYRVALQGSLLLDFNKAKGETIHEDLCARDFTINAMAYPLDYGWPVDKEKIIDPFAGKADLEKRKIRHLCENTFCEDPLRMLRAVRFMAQLNFEIEDETINLIRRNSEKIRDISGERITSELFNIFGQRRTYYYLGFLDKHLDLMDKIFPEVQEMKNIGECKYHVVDSWTHSIYTVKVAENVIYANGFFEDHIRKAYENHTNEIIAGDRSRLQLVKLGALLHDIGKPSARRVDSKGRVRFRGHELTGAEIAREYAERLKLSTREKEILQRYIILHMSPLQSYKENDVSGKALYKMFNEMGDETLDILLIALADIIATRKLLDPREEMGMFKVHIEYIANNYLTRYIPLKKISNFVTGKDVMEILHLSEGERVGKILDEIKRALYFGEIPFSRESILNYIEENFKES